MASFRFIHAADLHLDSPFIGISGLDDSLRSFVQESTFRALERLVKLAIDEQVDFIVISGDIYDSSHISLRAQLRFLESLERLGAEGIAVYVIHGNHDPLDSTKLSMKMPAHVYVFGAEPGSVTAVRRSDRQEVAVVSGMSYPTSKVTDNIALRYPAPIPKLYHIGLLHANVDGDPQHETYAPCSQKDLIRAGYHYWALGHVHSRRTLREAPYIVYPGNIQGRHIRETGPKGCYVVDVDDQFNTRLRFHELDSMRWVAVDAPVDAFRDVDEWRRSLADILARIASENANQLSMVRVRITGRGPIHRQLESGHVLEELLADWRRKEAAKGAACEYRGCVWIESFSLQSGGSLDMQRLLAEDSFVGDLLRLVRREQKRMQAPDGAIAASLQPLLEHAEIRTLLEETAPDEIEDWIRRAEELTLGLLLRDRCSQEEGAEP